MDAKTVVMSNTRVHAKRRCYHLRNAVEGSKQYAASASGDAASKSSFAQLQTGLERSLRTKGMYTVSTSPRSSTVNDALTVLKRKKLD